MASRSEIVFVRYGVCERNGCTPRGNVFQSLCAGAFCARCCRREHGDAHTAFASAVGRAADPAPADPRIDPNCAVCRRPPEYLPCAYHSSHSSSSSNSRRPEAHRDEPTPAVVVAEAAPELGRLEPVPEDEACWPDRDFTSVAGFRFGRKEDSNSGVVRMYYGLA